MNVLVIGSEGQLGRSVSETVPEGFRITALSRADLDITNSQGCRERVRQEAPHVIINCAAYTAVDQAESESGVAFLINGQGAANLAQAAASQGCRLIQVSTDYVFDGQAQVPYGPQAQTRPGSIYGKSKLEGEAAVRGALPESGTIIRTGWLYSARGRNFLLTMLSLLSNQDHVHVVCDQIGTPTHCRGLAGFIWQVVCSQHRPDILHWSDAGVASWYDFAVAIQEEALCLGLLTKTADIIPVSSEEYPQKAPRPAYSVLDKSASYRMYGVHPEHWRAGLRRTLTEITEA